MNPPQIANPAAGTFTTIVTIANLLTQNAITIGIAIAILVFVFRTIQILFTTTNTPAGRSERWDGIRTALIVAFLIGIGGAAVRVAVSLGQMVK